jgi:hypothetical protein
MYSTLVNDYHFPPARIYLLNYDGTNPEGANPDGMIDYPATVSNVDLVFSQLSAMIDGDDELFVWVTDHGRGYLGDPGDYHYGYMAGFASVDPGDEQDYLERDFKLRSLATGGDYAGSSINHGMNVVKVMHRWDSGEQAYRMYRQEFVSRFANVYFEKLGRRTDVDISIERLIDYLPGDTDRDGYVETDEGEVFDYDADGHPPYDPETGAFDEGDWGNPDDYEDDFNNINSGYPGESYILFDANFDNHLDIDFNYVPGALEIDGTDLDNQGLFDGIDANDDGDMDDWISIDEIIFMPGPDMRDDELASFLDRVHARVISVFMEQCFSGGFVEDLSAPGRVISTATREEYESFGNVFVGHFTGAFHCAAPDGTPVDADADGNHHISMSEAFNYAAKNDDAPEIPQYDDNADAASHPYPIPQGGDGALGAVTYLESFYGLALTPAHSSGSGDPGHGVVHRLQVTNTGNVTDTYSVSASGYAWPTTGPATVGPLAANGQAGIEVLVSIPSRAPADGSDTAIVTVTSLSDATQLLTATLTTVAESPEYLFLPAILK